MNTVRTVSDTKRDFYRFHTRPIHSIYRRVVEELMVEMHLLSVNSHFRYDPIYALGVVSSFDQFMQGYRPEPDRLSIFNALCQSLSQDPQTYQQDADHLKAIAPQFSSASLLEKLSHPDQLSESSRLRETLQEISQNGQFKYSRLFAVGLFTLIELVDADLVKDEKRRTEAMNQLCEALHLPADKLHKDLDLYRSNLEKMAQARLLMADILESDRKKREQRAAEQAAALSTAETASSSDAQG